MDILIMDTGGTIKGESTLTDFKDTIELLSYSHGVSQQITGDQSNQKRTSGKPNHQDFTVTKYMDLATCSLIDYCDQAKPIPDVKVIVGQNEEGKTNQIMVYEMKNALVSSYSVGGGGGGKPQETVTLNYTSIAWTYKPQQAAGSATGQTSAAWDLTTNTTGASAS
jgi:type VI secretion system secreted protein Hcp